MGASIHIICGKCGSAENFSHRLSHEIDDETSESHIAVEILCENCGTLTLLSDVIKETSLKYDEPKLISTIVDMHGRRDFYMVGFDSISECCAYKHDVHVKNIITHDVIGGHIMFEFMGALEEMSDDYAKRIAVYIPTQKCYKNYSGLLDQAWDCQTPKQSLASISDKLYWLVFHKYTPSNIK